MDEKIEELLKNDKVKDEEDSIRKKEKDVMVKGPMMMSDSEVMDTLSTMTVETMSEWTDFVAKKKKENPDMDFKAIVAEFKKQQGAKAQLSELSESDLLERINELKSILESKYPAQVKEEKKMENEVVGLKEKIKEMESRFNEPDKKTVKVLAYQNENAPIMDTNVAFWGFLKQGIK